MASEIRVIDSHTGGEPTRLVVAGGPDLGAGTAAERLVRLRSEHDDLRTTVVNEPRGFDAMVGAVLCTPAAADAAAQVIFFNAVGYLGMCVHGTIGVAHTLRVRGDLDVGKHRFETPVGDVGVEIHADGSVSVRNVRSYRLLADVRIAVPGVGRVSGDVAWGGNWFFLTSDHGQALRTDNIPQLTDAAVAIRNALIKGDVTGTDGALVDHIELFGPPNHPEADSRSFVLCPGREYDRSPCGTGTSAKMACLAADGKLAPGQVWRQESIIGSVFSGHVEPCEGGFMPRLRGRAWITGEATLRIEDGDPFAMGIRL